ncbi:MAG: hypothetical protein WEB87_03165, partial [Bacteriovoracaceae bacterium]
MEEKEEKEEKKLSDIVKKMFSTGISAAFMTEEGIRNLVQDLPLPKDVIQGLLQNAKATKTEFILSVKKELKSYLDRVDLSKEIDRVLDDYDIEVMANIKFKMKSSENKTTKNKIKTKNN